MRKIGRKSVMVKLLELEGSGWSRCFLWGKPDARRDSRGLGRGRKGVVLNTGKGAKIS